MTELISLAISENVGQNTLVNEPALLNNFDSHLLKKWNSAITCSVEAQKVLHAKH